jgi:hypothetical protein
MAPRLLTPIRKNPPGRPKANRTLQKEILALKSYIEDLEQSRVLKRAALKECQQARDYWYNEYSLKNKKVDTLEKINKNLIDQELKREALIGDLTHCLYVFDFFINFCIDFLLVFY